MSVLGSDFTEWRRPRTQVRRSPPPTGPASVRPRMSRISATSAAIPRDGGTSSSGAAVGFLTGESSILPLKQHLKLHASQLNQKSKSTTHPLHSLQNPKKCKKLRKKTIFNDKTGLVDPKLALTVNEHDSIKGNMKTIHTTIVFDYLTHRNNNKVINIIPPEINLSEKTLPRKVRRTLAQLRTGKSPFLNNYKYDRKMDPKNNITSNCQLCQLSEHNVHHLFTCPKLPTTLTPLDLWNNPVEVAALLEAWELRIGDIGSSAGWMA